MECVVAQKWQMRQVFIYVKLTFNLPFDNTRVNIVHKLVKNVVLL